MYYDAIDNVESSIPDTSSMYNYWTSSVELGYHTYDYKKTITLPAIPSFLVITGDVNPIYEFPDINEIEGYYVNYKRLGKKVTLSTTDVAGQIEYTFGVHIWY